MRSWERLPFTQWAEINMASRFISVEPLSGYRVARREDDGYVIWLEPDATDEALGRALLEALDRSRFIQPCDEPAFFEHQRNVRCIRNWQKKFMRLYGYESRRRAHMTMDRCDAARAEGKISIRPSERGTPECHTALPPELDFAHFKRRSRGFR